MVNSINKLDFRSVSGRFKHLFKTRFLPALIAGFGGFATIAILAQLSSTLSTLLIVAPFGASCVLVFALPQSPLAQPRNVIGGHLVSTIVGLIIFMLLGSSPVSLGLGVGIAITAMLLTKTTHPPAGADPIVVILTAASWHFLFLPIFAGAVTIVAIGMAFHRYVPGHRYPA